MRNLRIAHIADTHLGYKSSALINRDDDFLNSWRHACQAIVDSAPDLIIHAGDVFHSSKPDWKALTGFTAGVKILLEAGAPIFIIAGNHDTSGVNLNHTVFTFASEILPQVVTTNAPYPTLHHVDTLETDVVLVPHKALLDKTLTERIQTIRNGMDVTRRSILVSHGSITKDDPTSEMGSVAIPHEITEYPWDYMAFGHLHVAQPYGTNGWYSGSTERCGWSDYSGSPAWTLVSVLPSGAIEHYQREVPYMPMLQLPEINCIDLADDDVTHEIFESLQQSVLSDYRHHIRIKLTNFPYWKKRKIERIIQQVLVRSHPRAVFNVTVDTDNPFSTNADSSDSSEVIKGIGEYFEDFVREQNYPDKSYELKLLSRGLELLAQNDDRDPSE